MSFFRFKRTFVLMTAFAMLALAPSFASAQLTPENTGLSRAGNNTNLVRCPPGQPGAACIADVIGKVVDIVLGFVGVVLFIIFLYAGFLYLTSNGEAENVKKAKLLLKNAVIGVILITLAYVVTNFVLTQLSTVANGP